MSPEASKKKILVVDDEESIREVLRARLEAAGYQILSVASGEKALQLIQNETPDVIVLDVFLPGEDGLAVLKKLKRPVDRKTGEPSKTRQIPVIVITGKAEQMEEMFRMEDAFAFFGKPFDFIALQASIQKALNQKKA